MRSELMSLICNYLELHQYQKTRSHPPILSDSLEHYGDETQYIVEAVADVSNMQLSWVAPGFRPLYKQLPYIIIPSASSETP